MFFDDKIKNFNTWDIGLVKLSVFFFTLWLVSMIPGFRNWVGSISHWWFLAAFIVLALGPVIKAFKK